jgi:hypothetical protein
MTPRRLIQLSSFVVVLIYALSIGLHTASAEAVPALPSLNTFAKSMNIGWPGVVSGVYVRDEFALRVVQQPKENPAFVSSAADALTEFSLARQYKNIGLLAHNHLAGENFFLLKEGDQVKVIFGNGKIETFVVSKVLRYQALTPTSPYTDFVDLATGERMNVAKVFKTIYTGEHHLTFQTCIAKDNELSWGRLFVIAVPLPPANHADLPENDR